MKQTIYGLISDDGDGTSHVDWYRTLTEVLHVLDEVYGYENYWANRASPETLSFPAELDLEACGFVFSEVGKELTAAGRTWI